MGFLKSKETPIARVEHTGNSLEELQCDINNREQFQNELAQNLLKNLILINGGAVIGLLTFIGNSDADIDTALMKSAFTDFSYALMTTLFAYFFAFLSQGFFTRGSVYGKRRITTPGAFTRQKKEMSRREDVSRWIGQACFIFSACPMLASLWMFGTGGLQAVDAITL